MNARVLLVLLIYFLFNIEASAQTPTADRPAEVMILGTFHFANPGKDVHNSKVKDVKSPKKQKEILAVVDSLAKFKPTKIAVERLTAESDSLNLLFDHYKNDHHSLTRSEDQQIGFRLAKRFNHDKVYAINYKTPFAFRKVQKYAKENDTTLVKYFEDYFNRESVAYEDSVTLHGTIREALILRNQQNQLEKSREPYARIASVGDDLTHLGAEVVAEWYKRNIYIFANIENMATQGDRIIVIFGSGHAPILRDFVKRSPQFKLINPIAYL